MTRAGRRQDARSGEPLGGGEARAPRSRVLWAGIAGLGAVLVIAWFILSYGWPGDHHPAPRTTMDHASHVVPAARYEAFPRVAQTYEMVAAVPMIIDGIYCYCRCSEHSGHHSLLDCFASDHAARCDVCLSEATMAYRMSREGADLEAIRAEIDGRYGS